MRLSFILHAMPALETELRDYFVELMPLEHAPAHVRLAFHDAGTFDARTRTGGAHGTVRLPEELNRGDNTGWGQACMALIADVKSSYPTVSWADLVAVAGAAAIQKCGGPPIELGLGRSDANEPAPPHRLPGGYEAASLLKLMFARMGLGPRDLVVLSGAHVLGHTQRRPFTADPWRFSNAYFVQLVGQGGSAVLGTDTALLHDPELRPFVELYAQDESRFLSDFADAFRRMTWLGNLAPDPGLVPATALRDPVRGSQG
jgi:L-ascorbate peroxidase